MIVILNRGLPMGWRASRYRRLHVPSVRQRTEITCLQLDVQDSRAADFPRYCSFVLPNRFSSQPPIFAPTEVPTPGPIRTVPTAAPAMVPPVGKSNGASTVPDTLSGTLVLAAGADRCKLYADTTRQFTLW